MQATTWTRHRRSCACSSAGPSPRTCRAFMPRPPSRPGWRRSGTRSSTTSSTLSGARFRRQAIEHLPPSLIPSCLPKSSMCPPSCRHFRQSSATSTTSRMRHGLLGGTNVMLFFTSMALVSASNFGSSGLLSRSCAKFLTDWLSRHDPHTVAINAERTIKFAKDQASRRCSTW